MIKEILSKTAFLSLGIMALSLSLNPARAMEDDEEKSSAPTVSPNQCNILELLPGELQILTLQKLSIKDLGQCAQVCHKWKAFLSHEGRCQDNSA